VKGSFLNCFLKNCAFLELAANCVVGLQQALSSKSTDSSKQLVLDRNCTVYGQFVDFVAVDRELSPLPAIGERAEGDFATLLYDEPLLALSLLQTCLHSMVKMNRLFVVVEFF
jgi:hypothetical protein